MSTQVIEWDDIEQALDDADLSNDNWRDDYPAAWCSDNRTACPGITVEYETQFTYFMVKLAQANPDAADWMAQNYRSDSMGRRVIFYWPTLAVQ